MKLSTTTQELLGQLQTVSRVASTRSAVQALSGVQVAAGDDGVELRATDMEIGLRVPLRADVTRPGEVVLPARLLLEVARQLPGADVSLELRPSEGDVEIISATAQFHLRTLRAEDFPPLPAPDAETRIPVRIGRVSSREAERATFAIVSTKAAAGTLTTWSPPG